MRYVVNSPISYRTHEDFSMWYRGLSKLEKQKFFELHFSLLSEEDERDKTTFNIVRPPITMNNLTKWYDYLGKKKNTVSRKHGIVTAHAGGILVGILSAKLNQEQDGNSSTIAEFVVDKKYRHRGIGRILLNEGIKLAKCSFQMELSVFLSMLQMVMLWHFTNLKVSPR